MKKNEEPETMRSLHKIRETHYEATKENSLKDVLHDIHKQAEEIIKKYQLDLPVFEKQRT